MNLETAPRVLVVLGTSKVFGRERSNIQVFKCLREVGYKVLFVTDAVRGKAELEPFLAQMGFANRQVHMAGLFSKGMPIGIWLVKIWCLFKGSVEFAKIVRDFRPTHIHLTDSTDFIGIYLGLISTNTVVVYRLGDSPLQDPVIYQWIWRWMIKPRVSKFVCISKFIKNRLDAIKGNADDFVIYNFPPERFPYSAKIDIVKNREQVRILFLGQIIPQKGVSVYVEAACDLCETFPRTRFVVAGPLDQDNEYSTAVINFIINKGMIERFEFLGYVEDVYSLFTSCDIHVMPSIYSEPLGNVVVEAKCAGIPSVVFPVGGTPELIEHEVDGYICTDITADSLKKGIIFFLKNRDICINAGYAAKRSLQRLGITKKKFVNDWRKIYEE